MLPFPATVSGFRPRMLSQAQPNRVEMSLVQSTQSGRAGPGRVGSGRAGPIRSESSQPELSQAESSERSGGVGRIAARVVQVAVPGFKYRMVSLPSDRPYWWRCHTVFPFRLRDRPISRGSQRKVTVRDCGTPVGHLLPPPPPPPLQRS